MADPYNVMRLTIGELITRNLLNGENCNLSIIVYESDNSKKIIYQNDDASPATIPLSLWENAIVNQCEFIIDKDGTYHMDIVATAISKGSVRFGDILPLFSPSSLNRRYLINVVIFNKTAIVDKIIYDPDNDSKYTQRSKLCYYADYQVINMYVEKSADPESTLVYLVINIASPEDCKGILETREAER